MSKSITSITESFSTATRYPLIFAPALAPIAVHVLFTFLAHVVFAERIWTGFFNITIPNPSLVWIGSVVGGIVGFIASCMVVDMADDVLNGRSLDLNASLNEILGRFGVLLISVIVAGILAITVVLIPVSLFIVTIAVIERTGAVESTKGAFNFVVKNVGEVLVFIIVVIILSAIFSFGFSIIPVVGPYLGSIVSSLLNVVFTVASVRLYSSLKEPSIQYPPPPPPPPPPYAT